jgi:speckle-type POZ protein
MIFQANRTWELSVPEDYHGHESRYVRDDRLSVQCTVDVLEEYSPEAAVETRNCFVCVVPPPTIAQDLHKLLLADESGYEERRRRCMEPDVTFVVEETEIQAHKLVLAMRSSVFAAEFRWHTNGTRLSIDDISASTFRAMLRFIYTDELPIKASNTAAQPQRACKEKYASKRCGSMARDLLVAADRYDLERLRLMCHNILAESIDTSTVMGTLLLVRGRHSCRELEDSCIEYIASHPEVYAGVMATEECQELKKSCSPLIIEIMERVATHNHNRNGAFESSSTPGRLLEKSWSMYSASEEVHGVHEYMLILPSPKSSPTLARASRPRGPRSLCHRQASPCNSSN